jgi:uncharacterized protein (TIGR03437 family)
MRCSRSAALFLLNALASTAAWSQIAKPTVNAVENVASYGNGPISPGEMVVIFGTGMGPSNLVGLQLDQQGRVANILSQVQVLFDGNPAPLVYVSAQQISAMVPYGLAGRSATQIQVVYQGSMSDSFQKPIAPSAPGIFTADSSGQGQAAMTNSDNSYNTATNPARPGSWVTFYLTGEGQTNPLGSDGNIATSTANVALSVTILIAGRTAQLLYAGSAPGNVNGFCQINAVIPPDLQYGGNLPLVVQIGGVSSQTGVTLAVSGPPAPVPGAPQNPTASVNSSAQIVLTWTPADSLATRFHIERQVAGSGFSEIAVIQSSATTFTDVNVTAGTVYQYRIRAEDDYGLSAYSAVVSATVPLAQLLPPSNLQAAAVSQTQINLTWNAANTNATKFHIERKSGANGTYAEIAAAPSTATSYQDTTVQPSTTYTYRMRSEGATGALSPYSSETSATTPAPPLPPAPTLQVTATSSSQVHLSWSTTATGIILFSVERRTTTGVYSQISQPTATSTSFDDSGLIGSTTYLYRMRAQTGAGFSLYSNEVTVTTLQALPAAPTNLQAAAISSSQVNLTWTNNAPDATAIRVEYLPAGSANFADIGAAATLTSTGVPNLQTNTAYSFRVRAQNAAGYSTYSNMAMAKTLQALPAAPTNLQATAISSSQVNLTWTNNAPDATAIRVESQVAGSTPFTDIGAAPSLTSTAITNLQPNTTYSFRVRAQNAAGYSAYSNIATAATLPIPTSVFLVHGIGQGSRNMQGLKATLESNLDNRRYVVNATFDYSYCDANSSCTAPCSISDGANLLASTVLSNTSPGSNIIVIGFSMGGLMARDMVAHNYGGVVTSRKITALLTLGTPNLGYPYGSLDSSFLGSWISGTCPILSQQMYSDFRSQQSSRSVILSYYLSGLTSAWNSVASTSYSGYWLAISGGYCKQPIRTGDLTNSLGCPDYNVVSDGVMCDQSARYIFNGSNTPTQTWYGDPYAHAAEVIMCGFSSGNAPLLYDPPTGDALSQTLWNAIKAH